MEVKMSPARSIAESDSTHPGICTLVVINSNAKQQAVGLRHKNPGHTHQQQADFHR
jgi:hypothetical protein